MILLTIFYDGSCPICVREVAALLRRDKEHRIEAIDIMSANLSAYSEIDVCKAKGILHALDSQRNLLLGLDAAHKAWQIVGKGWMYAPLRWKLIKPFADKLYLIFARNRYRLSFLLTGTSHCKCNKT